MSKSINRRSFNQVIKDELFLLYSAVNEHVRDCRAASIALKAVGRNELELEIQMEMKACQKVADLIDLRLQDINDDMKKEAA